MSKLVVPQPGHPVAQNAGLPPRKRARRKKTETKPRLSSHNPQGLPTSPDKKDEMHPAIVISLGFLLFLNGWEATDNLVYVPLMLMVHATIEQSIEEMTNEEMEEMGTTPDEVRTLLDASVISGIVCGIAHLGLAAALAGILTWRGYAVYCAVCISLLLVAFQTALAGEVSFLTIANVPAIVGILVMLKYLAPAVWPRLMAKA